MEQADFSKRLPSAAEGPEGLTAPDRVQARSAAGKYAVYLHVWGLALMISAIYAFLGQFKTLPFPTVFISVAGWAAVAIVWYRRRAAGRPANVVQGEAEPSESALLTRNLGAVAICVVACVGLLFVLIRIGTLHPLNGYIGKGLLIAAFYAQLSRSLGMPLALLAAWQFVLTFLVGWSYLGFAPVLIDGFGGAGLVALAFMIQLWNRGRSST
ncbi:hypothetical protein [Paenibacillus puerhi]|uniref:hypothetical protein n=1 Tax=Paenibacillus puerhi TaxID=2692622 RepID=UPI00135BC131|nr:hypothetical protein [Paenibacillus puerhi]